MRKKFFREDDFVAKRIGRRTLCCENSPAVKSFAAVTGKKEGEGPLGDQFDKVFSDDTLAQDSWEKAESRLQTEAVQLALQKISLPTERVQLILAGDLMNQCIGSTFGLREMNLPFLGQFGACSTMAQTIALASIFVECGLLEHAIAVTSSHFCSAERQFRFPLEYGSIRTPTAQWTVTGAGAVVLGQKQGKPAPVVEHITIGTIVDLGITDANNMGAAMAPAASQTLCEFFRDTGTSPRDYDRIFTGDLGQVGSDLLKELLLRENFDIEGVHDDCGKMIFSPDQKVNSGGSGCGCSASVLCGDILPRMRRGDLKNILFVATGALMSTTSSQQGESIPGIAHLVHFRAE